MNARDVIRSSLLTCIRRGTGKPWPEVIISELSAAGFTIMSKEDVKAVRDKALEEAAKEAEQCELYDARDQLKNSDTRRTCAAAIRSLKSIPHKE